MLGRESPPLVSGRTDISPVSDMVQRPAAPDLSLAKTIVRPSGELAGLKSSCGFVVSWRRLPRAGSSIQMSALPDSVDVYKTRPSGIHAMPSRPAATPAYDPTCLAFDISATGATQRLRAAS